MRKLYDNFTNGVFGAHSMFMNRRLMVIISAGSVLISCAFVLTRPAKADFDLPGLNQQVQNHEGRITNLENDVNKIHNDTGVKPADNHVPVTPAPAATPAPTATEAPTPIVVASVPTEVSRTNKRCIAPVTGVMWIVSTITYSDGTQKVVPESVPDNCNYFEQ